MIPHDLLGMFRSYQRLILDDLEELVGFESPSGDKIALEALKGVLIDRLRMLSACGDDRARERARMAISSPGSRARPSGARPWCWAIMIRSGRMERWTGCRSASTTVERSGPGSST